jgi:hypothetical protein
VAHGHVGALQVIYIPIAHGLAGVLWVIYIRLAHGLVRYEYTYTRSACSCYP